MSYPNLKSAFAECVNRLKAQGCPAIETGSADNSCAYRNDKGHGCAVGIMLSDQAIDEITELGHLTLSLGDIWDIPAVQADLAIDGTKLDDAEDFWADMQCDHDKYPKLTGDAWWVVVAPEFVETATRWNIDLDGTVLEGES